ESGIRVNIVDFAGDTLSLEGFIDWLVAVEELIARNDIQETEDQLVSRYISGLRVQIMDYVNMFDPMTLSDAYQSALAFEKDDAAYEEYEEAPVYDEEPKCEEEYVSRDVGVILVVRRSCLTPKADGDAWLKHNIFESTCTIWSKVCTFVFDSGSCDNLIATEAVQKLGLKTKNHPEPYKLQWFKKDDEVTVSKRVHVSFSMGNTYKDNVWCDVVAMDACHLLLGRPWEYDHDITHNGRTNTYSFLFGGVKIF
ncbi:putative reverse transcriptase domain-containing protein, partial [Tanacetum coccineum]